MTMHKDGIYLAEIESLTYKNFKEEKKITFLNESSTVYPWTIFMGINGTGKTNLLKIISSLEAKKTSENISISGNKEWVDCSIQSKIVINSSKIDFGFISRVYKRSENSENFKLNYPTVDIQIPESVSNFLIYAYGVNRKSSKDTKLTTYENSKNNESLFNTDFSLINLNEWLLQTDYAIKNGQETAQKRLDLIRKVITGDVFPAIEDFKFISDDNLNNYVEFKTAEGWFRYEDLAYGYQSTLSWIIDFCKKMFDRYPESENPLKDPALVLIDEIDLHLHPKWQRNITQILSNIFPNTQFIATTHSPLVIQSLEHANVYVLNKEDKYVTINRMPNKTFRGWSVEDILNKVMGLESKVKSDKYLELMEEFDKGLDNDNPNQSKSAFDELMNILPEEDTQRRVLNMQIKQFDKFR